LALALALPALALPARAAAPVPVPALTRIASNLSGLRVRKPVRVVYLAPRAMDRKALALLDRDYPPAQQSYDETVYRLLGLLNGTQSLRPTLIQVYTRRTAAEYDPVGRVLFVRKGRDVRSVVLRELVQALQDQAFDLRRLTSLRRGHRDAALAAAAAVEGHAFFATQVLGGRVLFSSGRPASHRGPRARAFLDLERQFPATTGVRFIAGLRNVGGNAAVLAALRRFPRTTKQVFHIDAFLGREAPKAVAFPEVVAGLERLRDDSFGELDVRALLAVHQVPRLDHAAEGWSGGRTALYRSPSGARALVLALNWETETDAAEWTEAAGTFVNEAFDADRAGLPATVPCGDSTCWFVAGRGIALRRTATRTALAIGPTVAAAEALATATAAS
jgi:hypothetical protein